MSVLGAKLVWCAIQVTVLSLVTACAYLAVRRRSSAAGPAMLLAGLLGLLALSALSLSPWPRWWTVAQTRASVEDARLASKSVQPPKDRAVAVAVTADGGLPQSTPALAPVNAKDSADRAWVRDFAHAFVSELAETSEPRPQKAWDWRSVVFLVLVGGAAAFVVRVACGLWLVERCRRRSAAIDNADLLALVQELSSAMNLRRPVALRQSDELSTPAAVGWRRPTILLPPTWPQWSDDERRAVLAHELAHVQRNDFLAGLASELVKSLHFYHPLVRWLAGRLRLDQELSADTAAARCTGGPGRYLVSLASLAVREDDRVMNVLVRPFLPPRGTLLRRIDMLRNAHAWTISRRKPGRTLRFLLPAAVALAAFVIAGIRVPLVEAPRADAATPANPDGKEPSRPLDLRFVPADTVYVAVMRPAELLRRPYVSRARDAGGPAMQKLIESFAQSAGFALEELEEVVLVVAPVEQPGVVLRTAKPVALDKVVAAMVPGAAPASYVGKTYFKASRPKLYSVYLADDKTVVAAPEVQLLKMIASGTSDTQNPRLAAALTSNLSQAGALLQATMNDIRSQSDLVMALDAEALAEQIKRQPALQGNPVFRPLAPLWEQTAWVALGARLEEGRLTVRAAIECKDVQGTEAVTAAADGALKLARSSLDALAQQAPRQVGAAAPQEAFQQQFARLYAGLSAVLATADARGEGRMVFLEADAKLDAPGLLASSAAATAAAREAARRAMCQNNLRQIGLAMYVYHEVHGSLPPAITYDANGKPLHSWRVRILPYLDQDALYRKYDLNEPWDGPNNSKLIPLMPELYRCPSGTHPAGHTDYAVMVGEDTAFPPGAKKGVSLNEIAAGAGTHRTFLVGEISASQLSIPWTKPEDVVFSQITAIPGSPTGFSSTHGDDRGFNLVFADASSKYNPINVAPNFTWK